jgi:hypothetical protein
MGNPILLMINAGFGETPLPADALVKPGDELNVHNSNDDSQRPAKIVAVVPVGTPLEYAIADQALPPQPRPLMCTKPRHRETLYVIEMDGGQVTVLQSKMAKGLQAARQLEPAS